MNKDKSVQRARITAFVLTSAVVVTLLFLVFAFVQKNRADKQYSVAMELKMQAEAQRLIAEQCRTLADQARKDLEACRGK